MTRARLLSLALLLLIGSPRLHAQIADPVPDTIQPSGIVVDLVDVAQVYPSGEFPLAAQDALYALPEDDACFTYPAAQYDHDEGTPEGRAAVVGGYVYRGTQAAELWGQYVFGDIVTGRIFVVGVDALVTASAAGVQAEIRELGLRYGGEATTLLEVVGHTRADLRFGYDNRGEVYVLSKVNGKIWRFSGTPLATDAGDDTPETPLRPSLFPNPATDAVTLIFDRTPAPGSWSTICSAGPS